MSEKEQSNDYQEFVKLSDKKYYAEQPAKEPYKSELFDSSAVKVMPLYLIIGAILGLCIGIFAKKLAKSLKQQKRKKPSKKRQNEPFGIRSEFIKEAKSEREHRMRQRKKYGIFDKHGNRIDKP